MARSRSPPSVALSQPPVSAVTASGLNARIPHAVPALLEGTSENGSIDAHAVQPYYAGLLARACGLRVSLTAEGDAIIVATV